MCENIVPVNGRSPRPSPSQIHRSLLTTTARPMTLDIGNEREGDLRGMTTSSSAASTCSACSYTSQDLEILRSEVEIDQNMDDGSDIFYHSCVELEESCSHQ